MTGQVLESTEITADVVIFILLTPVALTTYYSLMFHEYATMHNINVHNDNQRYQCK